MRLMGHIAGITGFWWESEGKGRLEKSRRGLKDTINYVLKEQDGRTWTALISFRVWTSGRLLLIGQRSFDLQKWGKFFPKRSTLPLEVVSYLVTFFFRIVFVIV
jgi:hypothetical protein